MPESLASPSEVSGFNRYERTQVLVDGDRNLRLDLAREVLEAHEAQWLSPPQRGLVMVQLREGARGSLFYLGEVLVSEARVQVAGAVGIGLIAGDRAEDAEALALIDAALNAGLPETRSWQEQLRSEADRLHRQRAADETRLLETRVSFETMEVD